jgi:hypothetical protein
VNRDELGTGFAQLPRNPNEEPDMTHTHEYDCIVCGAHFDSSEDLAKHNEAQHISHAQGMERPRQDRDTEQNGQREPE